METYAHAAPLIDITSERSQKNEETPKTIESKSTKLAAMISGTRHVPSNHLVFNLTSTSASESADSVTSHVENEAVNFGVLIDMLRRTQEQLKQMGKRSEEQFNLVLAESEKQSSRIQSLEGKIDSLISRQELLGSSSSSSSSNSSSNSSSSSSYLLHASKDEGRHIDEISDVDYDTSVDEGGSYYQPNDDCVRECAHDGCWETFSIAGSKSKKAFCDAHSPWRLFCQRRKVDIVSLHNERKRPTSSFSAVSYDPKGYKDCETVDNNDDYCYVCAVGGELLMCDYCTLSYHVNCAGLKVPPPGDFKCPKCCSENDVKTQYVSDKDSMKQCEYVGCLEIFSIAFPRNSTKKWCDYHKEVAKQESRISYKNRRSKRAQHGSEKLYSQLKEKNIEEEEGDVKYDFNHGGDVKKCAESTCNTLIPRRNTVCGYCLKMRKTKRDKARIERLKKQKKHHNDAVE